jgi:magnesium chelatase subunit D
MNPTALIDAHQAAAQAAADALWAIDALRVDSHARGDRQAGELASGHFALGGIWLRAGHGPVREAWLAQLRQHAPGLHRLPLQIDDAALLGGIDLGATLQTHRLQWQAGVLSQAHQSWLLLPMAERAPRALIARLTQTLDQRQVHTAQGNTLPCHCAVIALDEADPDEAGLHHSLTQRLALWVDLRAISMAAFDDAPYALRTEHDIAQASDRLASVQANEADLLQLFQVADSIGVADTRALLFAWRIARIRAALAGRQSVTTDDLQRAVQAVLLPRATRMPSAETAPEDEQPQDSPPEPTDPPSHDAPPEDEPPTDAAHQDTPPDDMLLAAALAHLPPHLLDQLVTQNTGPKKANAQGQSGQVQRHWQRGRPLPSRPGKPGAQARMDVLATLRHAAPRQRLRQAPVPSKGAQAPARVQLRTEDFHTKRYAQHSPSCLILALDASGSAAMQRLAQAKGAVQLLLSQSYARRDSVCVIGFRGARAECLLAPTRSLVRAKRALARLPGGGGTPLASALQLSLVQALRLQREGQTPMLVVLSDGRANVTLAGLGGRQQAQQEAEQLAKHWAQTGFAALWIDTAPQPEPLAQALATDMRARYLPMPHVQAQRLAAALQREQSLG